MNGNSLLRRSLAFARCWRLALVAVVAVGSLLPTSRAFAQGADDSGWFDAPADDQAAPPQPYDSSPSAQPASEPAPAPASATDVEDNDPSALTTFRPTLDPYGAWVDDASYGTVWVPNREVVGADFAPYVSRGRWALTADNDWIWQSDYPFGWAVFHYGRWVWIPGHGWAWVPGRTYANAWVVWRVPTADYAYVGWAPMPPTWGFRYGYAFSLWYSPPLPYVFCPSTYVFDRYVHYHIVRDRYLVRSIASHTQVYPTPYRAPAQPTVRGAASPSIRSTRIAPSVAPRGPAISAARVPPSAVPAVRSAPPAAALRVAPARSTASASFSRQPFRNSPDSRERLDARQIAPRETVRRSTPSSSWSGVPRPSSVDRVRVAPRSVGPDRVRVAPSPSRSYSPAPARSVAPVRSYSPPVRSYSPPVRSFSPSFPRTHSGGGSRRR